MSAGGDRDWRPTAPWPRLRDRAAILRRIREFFHERGVLEVETPLLGSHTVPDLHLSSLPARLPRLAPDRTFFLQTSPEYAMKRLLATESEPIYQLGKAFRDGEAGSRHNPEFTLLEWYRPGWDHHGLMGEVDDLVREILGTPPAEQTTYGELFAEYLDLNPHEATTEELAATAGNRGIRIADPPPRERDDWLQILLAGSIEPRLGHHRPLFVHDFPPSQAALARIREDPSPRAERFELYVRGIELANGFHELTDPVRQRRRFERDLELRTEAGLPAVELDERFLAALEHGLPDCAGVALGVDRLVMLALGADRIEEVMAFPWDRA